MCKQAYVYAHFPFIFFKIVTSLTKLNVINIGVIVIILSASELVLSSISKPEPSSLMSTQVINDVTSEVIFPSDKRGDMNFGKSLSVHDNTMVVGAPGDNSKAVHNGGAVYAYDYIDKNWIENCKLFGTTTETSDLFGISVSVYSNTIAVGAVNKNRIISGASALQAGTVYTFLRVGVKWSLRQFLVATDGAAEDHFGISLSLYANRLLVGAADANIAVRNSSGAVYLFSRSSEAANFQYSDKTFAFDASDTDKFGFAVNMFEATAAVGAYQDDDEGSRSGSVYIYTVGMSSFSYAQKIIAFDYARGQSGNQGDALGFSLSLYGDTLALGAPYDDDAGSDAGSVYVYRRSSVNTPWSASAKLIAADAGMSQLLGFSVSLYENSLVIGAKGFTSDTGAAVLFTRSGAASDDWFLRDKIIAGSVALRSDDSFGYAVATYGTKVVVSSPNHDYSGATNLGGSVFHTLNVNSPTSEPSISICPSIMPSANPTKLPATSYPSRAPHINSPTSIPSRKPVGLTATPSLAPTSYVKYNKISLSNKSVSIIFYVAVAFILLSITVASVISYKNYAIFRKLFMRQNLSEIAPVETEATIIERSLTPRQLPIIASIYDIEQVTPSPRKKKKKRSNSRSDSVNSAQVLPFATRVDDNNIVIAEIL